MYGRIMIFCSTLYSDVCIIPRAILQISTDEDVRRILLGLVYFKQEFRDYVLLACPEIY